MMHKQMNIFLSALLLGITSGLRTLENGLGPPFYGAEENIVDFAALASDQKAALPIQVRTFISTTSCLLFRG